MLSCRTDRAAEDVLPPYVVICVGHVALVSDARPGDAALGEAVARLAADYRALLLANHGPVVAGPDLDAAVAAAEEMEETARLFFILEQRPHGQMNREQVEERRRVFGA